jgi:hypothetical protein
MYHRYENIILSGTQNIFWTQNNMHTCLLTFLPAELGIIQLILHTNMYMIFCYCMWLTFLKLHYPASSVFLSAPWFLCSSYSIQGCSHVPEMLIDTIRSEKILNWTLHVSCHLTVKPHKGQIHSIFVAESNMYFKFQIFNGSMTHWLKPLFSPCPLSPFFNLDNW